MCVRLAIEGQCRGRWRVGEMVILAGLRGHREEEWPPCLLLLLVLGRLYIGVAVRCLAALYAHRMQHAIPIKPAPHIQLCTVVPARCRAHLQEDQL